MSVHVGGYPTYGAPDTDLARAVVEGLAASPVVRGLELPIVESTPLANPFWQYSRDKIACEDVLVQAYRESGATARRVRRRIGRRRQARPLNGSRQPR